MSAGRPGDELAEEPVRRGSDGERAEESARRGSDGEQAVESVERGSDGERREQILELTVPLSPLLWPGERQPRPTKRLRPQDSLDLQQLQAELAHSTLATLSIGGQPWSVVSVFSPYTPDLQLMLLEASPDRYLPAPEALDPQEGQALMALWAELAGRLAERPQCERLCVGYNWSPRAWGEQEERGGFQSLLTKWHPMFWSWPHLPEPGAETEYARWIRLDELTAPMRRVMGDNRYAESLGSLLKERIRAAAGGELPAESLRADALGLRARMPARSLHELFGRPGWFTHFLQPVAAAIAATLRQLAETLTSMRFAEIDRLLSRVERGPLAADELERLRAAPQVRPYPEVEADWEAAGLPPELLPALYPAVERRCRESGPPEDWWRKGFGYALVLTERRSEGTVTLRLLPGVYVGPGGVVEAQRFVLRRPEDRQFDQVMLKRRSKELWSLAGQLGRKFPTAG